MINLNTSELKQRIRQAREAVRDEPEPYKIEAFKVILSKLIEQRSVSRVLPNEVVGKLEKTGKIPNEILQRLQHLKYKERILVLLHFSNTTLAKEEIKEKAKELGVDEGWWNGSNFRRDLMKRSKMVIEKKDAQGVSKYRLSNNGEAATKLVVEQLMKI